MALSFPFLGYMMYGRTPLIRTLVTRMADYPDRFSPTGKYAENSTKPTCLEITGYRIK